ncbi:class I SAM-dependent methyltransferase [Rhizobacter sp. Root1221]|uniref:class I SAM-dependent methyltransferase n=1 Tax=Rhizobacter sp. Root1221 TaxID=1736433 RepID=UPI0006FBD920|nr:class I SAM-dependent methyltransferase [Rhizobacter sp. Root1221]KQV95941.1 methyltransferase type 11 [Rhizobacter sp. Root1221]
MNEPQAVAERYARRAADDRYSLLRPDVWHTVQERQRAMLRLFARQGLSDLSTVRVMEVGCGAGGNLLELLRAGIRPEHLSGVELLPERYEAARAVLPAAVVLQSADALAIDVPPASLDIVFVSTVFSSLLDDDFQQRLADTLWRWVRPGGAVLWYDFVVDNPRNRDVRGVPLRRVRALFPQGRVSASRVTLAPPIARAVTRWHPAFYTLFNTLPFLRTHVLCWIAKP